MTPYQASCWLALLKARVAPHVLETLLQHFVTVEQVFAAPRAELARRLPPDKSSRELLEIQLDENLFAQELRWLTEKGHHLVTWQDEDYPPLLREIADPPLVLFVLGDRTLLEQPQIAIVGSRNPTTGGCENSHAFAGALAQVGFVITSGLALGIDACAHRGALAGGGKTLAVAGTGLDRVYPAHHRELAHAIAQNGALISEFPLGSPPRREHFPRRNRLISGMSLGVLVVEAALHSGSLITARLATDQGREVFAIPGSIHSPLARGCHALIRDGAKLVETAQDILEELGSFQAAASPAHARRAADPELHTLLSHVGYDPVDVDTLVERSGLTPELISSMLLQMELRGLIEAQPGGRYLRIA